MIERNIITLCEQFLTRFNVGVVKEDIVKLYRLGRRDYSKSTPRPILIQLGSGHLKYLIMESLYKIKSSPWKPNFKVLEWPMI